MRINRKEPFESWLKRSLREDPALAARVEKRLAEMRIEQDLIALRQSRGLTQAQLARMLGVSQPAVAKMEAQGGNLEIRTLARAADTRCPPGDSPDRWLTRIEHPHHPVLRFRFLRCQLCARLRGPIRRRHQCKAFLEKKAAPSGAPEKKTMTALRATSQARG